MDRVITLSEVVRHEIAAYAGAWIGSNGLPFPFFYVENSQEQIYCIVAPYDLTIKKSDLVIMTRIVNNQIVIDQDKTDKPLFDALIQAGIPHNQIIRAYLGEKIPYPG